MDNTDFLKTWSLTRIDLTKDIKTPNDQYTTELIDHLKQIRLPYGYHHPKKCSDPNSKDLSNQNDISSSDVKTDNMKPDDANEQNFKFAFLFYNKNQDIKAKVYDKVQELKVMNHSPEEYDISGGVARFEISLMKPYLKNKGYYHGHKLKDCILSVLEDSDTIFEIFLY